MLNPKSYIGDFNSEGFDSVESEDFDPGFGCVSPDVESVTVPPPMPALTQAEQEMWLYMEMAKSEQERYEEQMDYLRSKGVY